jgi:hypothetical protein
MTPARRWFLSATSIFLGLAVGQGVTAQVPERATYAFTNVTVIPMDSERLLEDQTVVVETGRITALGPAAETAVPADATRIDGRGKYLLPGLAEMHGHIPTSLADAQDVLLLYLAGGATTVRGMQGHTSQLGFRRRVRAGQMIGPRLWLAAPAMRGDNVPDIATADRLVRSAKALGFDLLKVHEGLTAEVYGEIVRVASEFGLPWGGHVSEFVGLDGAALAVVGRHAVEARREGADASALRERAQRRDRQEGLDVVGVGRLLVPREVIGEEPLGRRIDGARPHLAARAQGARLGARPEWARGGDGRDAALGEGLPEGREGHVVMVRPLVGPAVAQRGVELAGAIDVADESAVGDRHGHRLALGAQRWRLLKPSGGSRRA